MLSVAAVRYTSSKAENMSPMVTFEERSQPKSYKKSFFSALCRQATFVKENRSSPKPAPQKKSNLPKTPRRVEENRGTLKKRSNLTPRGPSALEARMGKKTYSTYTHGDSKPAKVKKTKKDLHVVIPPLNNSIARPDEMWWDETSPALSFAEEPDFKADAVASTPSVRYSGCEPNWNESFIKNDTSTVKDIPKAEPKTCTRTPCDRHNCCNVVYNFYMGSEDKPLRSDVECLRQSVDNLVGGIYNLGLNQDKLQKRFENIVTSLHKEREEDGVNAACEEVESDEEDYTLYEGTAIRGFDALEQILRSVKEDTKKSLQIVENLTGSGHNLALY